MVLNFKQQIEEHRKEIRYLRYVKQALKGLISAYKKYNDKTSDTQRMTTEANIFRLLSDFKNNHKMAKEFNHLDFTRDFKRSIRDVKII